MWRTGSPPGGDSQQTVHVVDLPPEARISAMPPGVGVVDLTPVIRTVGGTYGDCSANCVS